MITFTICDIIVKCCNIQQIDYALFRIESGSFMQIISASKKIISVLVLSCMIMVEMVLPNGMVASAAADVTAPVIDAFSLTLTSTGTTVGNAVTNKC